MRRGMSTEKQSTVAPTTRVPDERLIEYEGVRGMLQNMGRRVRGGALGFLPVVVGLAIIWTIFGSFNSASLCPTNLSNLLMPRAGGGCSNRGDHGSPAGNWESCLSSWGWPSVGPYSCP